MVSFNMNNRGEDEDLAASIELIEVLRLTMGL